MGLVKLKKDVDCGPDPVPSSVRVRANTDQVPTSYREEEGGRRAEGRSVGGREGRRARGQEGERAGGQEGGRARGQEGRSAGGWQEQEQEKEKENERGGGPGGGGASTSVAGWEEGRGKRAEGKWAEGRGQRAAAEAVAAAQARR